MVATAAGNPPATTHTHWVALGFGHHVTLVCFFFLSHLNALHGPICGTGGQVQVGDSKELVGAATQSLLGQAALGSGAVPLLSSVSC